MRLVNPGLDGTTIPVAVGDVLLIGLFVLLGEFQHYGVGMEAIARVPGTITPFLLGWLLVAILVGSYAADALADPRTAAARIGLTWIGAALVGQTLRATPQFPGKFAVPFLVVSLLVGLVLLVPYRVLLARR
ncbi:DUF3054 domain-containing protein [Natronomonas sp. EA1]|uniref:DUF3054 domain-containing protein n=1 Tax=Natronomonas sp. EA1 TaxID=3421655 RepID=UPI003EBF9059